MKAVHDPPHPAPTSSSAARRLVAVLALLALVLGLSAPVSVAYAGSTAADRPSGPADRPGPGGPPGDQTPPPSGVVNDCGSQEIFYYFRYNDSDTAGVDRGCSTRIDIYRRDVPALVATYLHVSCSDKISSDGVPTKSDLGSASRRITAYYIQKPDGKSCGFGNPSIVPTVDVGIVKTASKSTVDEGDEVTYTLKVTNASAVAAHDVVVSDPLAEGVSFVSASDGCGYDTGSRKVTCTVGTLPAPGALPDNPCGDREIFYRFEYNDSSSVGIDTGCSTKIDIYRRDLPNLVASYLHISCSDKISSDGVPTKSDLGSSSRRIAAYYIHKPDGKTCGQGTFTPPPLPVFTITVKVHASHCNEATVSTSDHDVDLTNNTSRVCVTVRTVVQTIQAEVYSCVNGQPSTTLISGATLAVPSAGLSGGNPLARTQVPAATYGVNATVPSSWSFVACGQSGVTITTPTAATRQVVVPRGGNGDGRFYATAVSKGYLEICKKASAGVSGDFRFRTPNGVITVPAGYCSPALRVNAGPVTVTELRRVGYHMVAGEASPSSRLASVNLSSQSITVTVVAGDVSRQTVATFTNAPSSGNLKVCQVAGSGVEVGTPFTFTTSATSQTYEVVAGPAPGGYCSVIWGTFTGRVTITQGSSSSTVSGIDVSPANRLVQARPASRDVTVMIDSGYTEVTFTNTSSS